MQMNRRSRAFQGLGAIAAIFGLLLTFNLFVSPRHRIFGHLGTYLMFFGPLFLAVSVLPIMVASHRTPTVKGSEMTAQASPTLDATPPESGKTILVVGLSLLAIPAILWIITPFAGSYEEITGFFGTVAFIFLGLPGLAVTIFALLRARKRMHRG
jgi:hypothetical protein